MACKAAVDGPVKVIHDAIKQEGGFYVETAVSILTSHLGLGWNDEACRWPLFVKRAS